MKNLRATRGERFTRRRFLQTAFAGLAAAKAATALGPSEAFGAPPPPTADTSDPVYHFLNRISWSVRSTALARARKIGIPAYLEEQMSARMVAGSNRVSVSGILRLPRKSIYLHYKDPYDVSYRALVSGMVRRAVVSPAQLYERMVEFWSDHFNITSDGSEPEVVDFQRTVIRPNALGKFRTLLQASARHVAMLYYLNNAESNKDHPNENYAREVMELHTLGVGSGYTEDDVKDVARAFTGWTADYTDYGGFIFDPDIHDTDSKTVLGQPITGLSGKDGVTEGVQVLNLLASDLRTAKFVCRKLCVRFISDDYAQPSAAEQTVVDGLAQTFQSTDGDIKAVLRALFATPEFAASAGQKLRRPLDFMVAALRATGTTFKNFDDLDYYLELLDQTPYGWGPPNGYPDLAVNWANTAGLLARWNLAQTVTQQALPSQHGPMITLFPHYVRGLKTIGQVVDRLSQSFFAANLPDTARAALITYATGGTGNASTPVTADFLANTFGSLAGLVLTAPAFQWR